MRCIRSLMAVTGIAGGCALLAVLVACTRATPPYRTFSTPEDAVHALTEAVKVPETDQLLTIFGPDLQEIVDTSDPAGRRAREVFLVAVAERWRLEDQGPDSKTLVIGNEDWPFPIPLTRDANGWRFDTAKGRDEVLTRRIGRNELAVIAIARTYVAAQRLYAGRPHDGRPAGLYAMAFGSDPGRENGLYWPAKRGEKRSPLGDLVALAAEEGTRVARDGQSLSPFHGYYFRILTAQGAAAEGGARDYVVNGEMKGGFALVAWPAQYNVTGITTFVVNQDGAIREKDLGPGTEKSARAMTLYNADESWGVVQ